MLLPRLVHVALLSVVALLPTGAQAAVETVPRPAGGTGPLPDGTYHCLIGYRTMLTYGDFHISGTRYTFTPPDHSRGGAGTYHVHGNGAITWNGDVGVINRPPAHVDVSAKDGVVKDSFYFRYHVRPGALDETASCRRT